MFINTPINNRRGSALLSVLIIMVVFSVISVALLNESLTEGKHAIKSERTTQALYYSKTGAVAVSKYLISNRKNTTVQNLFNSGVEQTAFNDTLAEGAALVKAIGIDEDTVVVESKWSDGTYEKTVKAQIKKGIPPVNVGKYGVQAKTTIDAHGSYEFHSHLAAYDGGTADTEDGFQFDEGEELGTLDEYMLTFPDILEWPWPEEECFVMTGDSVSSTIIDSEDTEDYDNHIVINGDIKINGSGSSLTFKTNSEMFVKINGSFELSGNSDLVLDGTGPVHILVDGDEFNLGANSVNALGDSIGPENFIFYVMPSGNTPEDREVILSGTSNITATIVAPDLEMTNSGTPIFSGISWVNSFDGGGNFEYWQNPLPDGFYDNGLFDWPIQITAFSY